jgi:hypothetical protein
VALGSVREYLVGETMPRDRDHTEEPDELITLAYCPGCETLALPADLISKKDGYSEQSQLSCPRCGTRVSADNYYDYVEFTMTDYGQE